MPSLNEFDLSMIDDLLTELGKRLDAQGIHASIYVVGGAAVAASLGNDRRMTRDIDALLDPVDPIRHEAARMADERGLPANWLNSSASPWIPGRDSDIEASVVEKLGLTVVTASPRHLLAMKMAAFRATDRADLVGLFERLEIRTPDQAADIVIEVYGEDHFANPGRDELVLSAQAVLAEPRGQGKAAPQRRTDRQGRQPDGRFAPLQPHEAVADPSHE